ncbi:hypothetical protein PGT21_021580 [Puccinia graminis f. sp. tritici]|uniref:Uncharacterized protein n=1 Tax=Puccinia graminis f. sp. tritici TaxID=56615 RepID=A0A5B0S180_PUCGR|nr:hypothetical protein PGT21_021580 [Puccinia graminis f. sp. tritici]KAA1131637.1 hypothetical protein PGTUg99_034301 [Puccinia graminis f. sp. tritici]
MRSKTLLSSLILTSVCCMNLLASPAIEKDGVSVVHDYGSTSHHPGLFLPNDGHDMAADQSNLDSNLYNLRLKRSRVGHQAPHKLEDLSVVKELKSDVALMWSYSPEQYSKLLGNWENNYEKMVILDESSKELQDSYDEVIKQLPWMERNHSQSKKLIEMTKRKFEILEEVKGLELGGAEIIRTNKLKSRIMVENQHLKHWYEDLLNGVDPSKIFNLYLDELEQLVLVYDQSSKDLKEPFKSEDGTIPTWSFLLKNMNFLYKNGFITKEDFRNRFHRKDFVKALVDYASDVFGDLDGLSSVTRHFKWRLLNDSFQDLGKEEERIVNYYYLTRKIERLANLKNFFKHDYILQLQPTNEFYIRNPPEELKKEVQELVKLFDVMNGIPEEENRTNAKNVKKNNSWLPNIFNTKIANQDIPYEVKLDDSLIKTNISASIVQFFEFIENEFFENIIQEESGKTDQEWKEFEAKMELILLYSKAFESTELKHEFWNFAEDFENNHENFMGCTSEHLPVNFLIKTFGKHQIQSFGLNKELYELCSKLNEDGKSSTWFSQQIYLNHLLQYNNIGSLRKVIDNDEHEFEKLFRGSI